MPLHAVVRDGFQNVSHLGQDDADEREFTGMETANLKLKLCFPVGVLHASRASSEIHAAIQEMIKSRASSEIPSSNVLRR